MRKCNHPQRTPRVCQALCWVLVMLSAVALFAVTAQADTGPKPSVRVNFTHMDDQLCYATLLSQAPSTGPHSVWDGDPAHIFAPDIPSDIFHAFASYEDPDGFYFLQVAWQIQQSKGFAWTYYPPSPFKILLYYPETGQFVSSGIYERYAFDSYYTVDMDGVNIHEVSQQSPVLTAQRTYQYRQELLSLAARILITILVEMGIALLFGFRDRKALLWLAGINIVTQVLLNLLLNLVHYHSGALMFVFYYLLFECIVFLLEACFYALCMNRLTDQSHRTGFYILYALVANAASFGAGFGIARLMPGIF